MNDIFNAIKLIIYDLTRRERTIIMVAIMFAFISFYFFSSVLKQKDEQLLTKNEHLKFEKTKHLLISQAYDTCEKKSEKNTFSNLVPEMELMEKEYNKVVDKYKKELNAKEKLINTYRDKVEESSKDHIKLRLYVDKLNTEVKKYFLLAKQKDQKIEQIYTQGITSIKSVIASNKSRDKIVTMLFTNLKFFAKKQQCWPLFDQKEQADWKRILKSYYETPNNMLFDIDVLEEFRVWTEILEITPDGVSSQGSESKQIK